MANTIWKYKLRLTESIHMPADARILCVQKQRGEICLWVLGDPDAPTRARRFGIYPTGGVAPPHDWPYIGTVQDSDLVWHVFEQL